MPQKYWSIQDFIEFKYHHTGSINNRYKHRQETDKDMFEDFPIQIIDSDDQLKNGYIHDIDKSIEIDTSTGKEIHRLTAYLFIDGKSFTYRKNCTAPVGCKIDWDKVVCAFTID